LQVRIKGGHLIAGAVMASVLVMPAATAAPAAEPQAHGASKTVALFDPHRVTNSTDLFDPHNATNGEDLFDPHNVDA
jgi:hypothetical protein